MSFDALTLTAAKDELIALLVGGRVQRVVRVSELAIGLEVYAGERHQLLISAEPASPQVRITLHKLRRGVSQTSPLQLLMRKYVRGARLTGIEQPRLERVIGFAFAGEHGAVTLVCEIMGRLSNIILLNDQGVVLDACKRVSAQVNRYRVVLPKKPYVAPPPQDKLDPLVATPDEVCSRVRSAKGGLARRMVGALFGVSPLLAREAVFRATGSIAPDDRSDEAVLASFATLQTLLRMTQQGGWQPSVAYSMDEGVRTASVFAPYLLSHLSDREPSESIMAAASSVLDQGGAATAKAPPSDGYGEARTRLHQMIGEQIKRRQIRLANLQESLVPEAELLELQFRARAILACAWRIEPDQETLVVNREEVDGAGGPGAHDPIEIVLDSALSPSENAQSLFAQYRKRQAAGDRVPPLIAETELELAFLRQADTDVEMAGDRAQLDEIEQSLREARYLRHRGKKVANAPSRAMSTLAPDGTQILVGRNSKQNAEITFHRAAPGDLWLHAHGVPGSHVIVRSGGRPVSEGTLDMAARLAAWFSASRGESLVQVDFTERRHVRPIRGAGPGMVTYTHELTTTVAPNVTDVAEAGA